MFLLLFQVTTVDQSWCASRCEPVARFSFCWNAVFLKIYYKIYIFENYISSVIRQKGESQNGGNRKAKHAKFAEKWTFLTPLYLRVSWGKSCLFFGKFVLVTSVLRFALLPYYRRFNPFWVSISFLYRLKTENYRSFLMFSGSVEKERWPEIREKDILTIKNKRAKQTCRILCWLILGDDAHCFVGCPSVKSVLSKFFAKKLFRLLP